MWENLLEQAFRYYGPVGLWVTFLVLGPGFTYLRTKNAGVRAKTRAQAVLHQFLREERAHAARLEERLNVTLARLDAEKEEVFALKLELATCRPAQAGLVALADGVQALERQVTDAEQ